MQMQKQRPKWAKTTLQDAGDLVGDPTNTRMNRYDFEEPPLALTTTKLMPPKNLFLVQSLDLQSYGEAAGNPFWESSMQEEYNSLLENQTWDLVPLPSGRKLVRCKWVYRTKSVADGHVSRYKAMLVSKGFQQVHGIDYDETFSPVVNMDSIHLALAIVTTKGWEVHQMNVKNAFLHNDLSEEIYMEQTPRIYAGFIFGLSTEEVSLWPQEGSEGMVCQDGLLPFVTKLCML
jgi:hypothetical protein